MSWRSVIGRVAGRSFGSPLASKPSSTCGEARSGRILPMGSSSESLPCSTSCMPAAVVMALVIDAIQNTLSVVMASSLGQVAFAERALIDHLIAVGRHRDHAGNLPGVAFLAQHLIDLSLALHGSPPDLLLIEVRRSSSRRPFPASVRGGPGRGSRARDDGGCDKQWALAHKHAGRTERQHKVRFCGGRVAIPMTAPDIRDMLKWSPRRGTILTIKCLKRSGI